LNKKISDKDKKDWQNFLSSNEKLVDKDNNFKKDNYKKTFTFDFHGFSLEDANKKINEIIYYAYDQKIKQLTIVTGKGLHSDNLKDPYVSKDFGILKHSIPNYVKKNKDLMNMISDIREAKIEDGGDGAFYIFLKNKL
tara:strand:+ start:482 stop:895 length:414 start_codon:yes stop_codon:yes gene_type:complete